MARFLDDSSSSGHPNISRVAPRMRSRLKRVTLTTTGGGPGVRSEVSRPAQRLLHFLLDKTFFSGIMFNCEGWRGSLMGNVLHASATDLTIALPRVSSPQLREIYENSCFI